MACYLLRIDDGRLRRQSLQLDLDAGKPEDQGKTGMTLCQDSTAVGMNWDETQ